MSDPNLTQGEFVLWACPKCAFAFDADHENSEGGWSCPLCEHDAVVARAERAEADADRLAVAALTNGPWGTGISSAQTQMVNALRAHDALVAERGAP